jgi:hypothetical protein
MEKVEMRNPDRIDEIIEELCELWHHHPDQRLGQLVYNLARPFTNIASADIFNVEDDDMLRQIKGWNKYIRINGPEEENDE